MFFKLLLLTIPFYRPPTVLPQITYCYVSKNNVFFYCNVIKNCDYYIIMSMCIILKLFKASFPFVFLKGVKRLPSTWYPTLFLDSLVWEKKKIAALSELFLLNSVQKMNNKINKTQGFIWLFLDYSLIFNFKTLSFS